MKPRSTCSSTPSLSASRQVDGSSRSSPRSRAKWLRVPAEMTSSGMSCWAAMPATSAWVPSPPATPSRSAPSATALRASSSDVDDPGALEQGDLGPEGLGLLLEPELGHLPAPGPRVHDQVRPLGRRGVVLAHLARAGITAQRRPAERDRQSLQRERSQHDPEQVPARVQDQHAECRQDGQRDGQPAHEAPVGQGPPHARGGHTQTDHADDDYGQAGLEADRQQGHQHRRGRRDDGATRQPALADGWPSRDRFLDRRPFPDHHRPLRSTSLDGGQACRGGHHSDRVKAAGCPGSDPAQVSPRGGPRGLGSFGVDHLRRRSTSAAQLGVGHGAFMQCA